MTCFCDFISFWHNSPHSVRMLWHLKTSVAAIREKSHTGSGSRYTCFGSRYICHTQQAKQEKFKNNYNIVITILRNEVLIGTLSLDHTRTKLITHYSTKFPNMVRLVIKCLIVIKCIKTV